MPGHLLYPGRGLCGELLLVDSDIPVTVLNACMKHTWENGPDLWLDSYPCPQAESYKYTRGEVLYRRLIIPTRVAYLRFR